MNEPAPKTLNQDLSANFHCRLCGECCSGDMKVFLNPGDLESLAAYEGYENTRRLFEKKLTTIDQGQHGAPLPRILFRGYPIPFCPFLENRPYEAESRWIGVCKLHYQENTPKPLICRLAPLARTLDLDTGEEVYAIVPPLPDCPGLEMKGISPQDKPWTRHSLDKGSPSQSFRPGIPNHLHAELEEERRFFTRLRDHLSRRTPFTTIIEELYYFGV